MDLDLRREDDSSFHLGEMFDSYEELEQKLENVSKRSLVHYWRRDSRTVNGAHMKTARPINERLKYYSVKYACIYGGQKFLPRGAGRRLSQSIRTDCPAHVMLRASKDGTKLEVTSLNNEHNHEISEELFKSLPQERKLNGEIKQEVQDLMLLHIDRKRLKEYVRLRTNKILRSKDLFNLAAANKRKREITPERAYQLFRKIHDIEKLQANGNSPKSSLESEDETSLTMKRMKVEPGSVHWNQTTFPPELDGSEENDGEDSYGEALSQGETSNDLDGSKGQLLSGNDARDIIPVNGEIVPEIVGELENGDPSVIVESIVNADGSVFVDEREFNTYCDQHLTNSNHSNPGVLGKIQFASTAEMEKLRQTSLSPSQAQASIVFEESSGSQIWLKDSVMGEIAEDSESEAGSNANAKGNRAVKNRVNASEVILSEEASHQLLQEQLAVLRAEKSKLYHETEMLKLKKDKLKMQINCYTSEMRKLEMEKEKLRLEIKVLKTKVADDDVSHYIFVP